MQSAPHPPERQWLPECCAARPARCYARNRGSQDSSPASTWVIGKAFRGRLDTGGRGGFRGARVLRAVVAGCEEAESHIEQ